MIDPCMESVEHDSVADAALVEREDVGVLHDEARPSGFEVERRSF